MIWILIKIFFIFYNMNKSYELLSKYNKILNELESTLKILTNESQLYEILLKQLTDQYALSLKNLENKKS